MIYLQNTTEAQDIILPVSYADIEPDAEHLFFLYNTVNLKKSFEQIVAMLGEGDFNEDFNIDFLISADPVLSLSGQYYKFPVVFDNPLTEGTYEYAFIAGGRVLSKGVAMVGDFDNHDEQYNKTIEYEQYRSD